jgi:hypothetical protein
MFVRSIAGDRGKRKLRRKWVRKKKEKRLCVERRKSRINVSMMRSSKAAGGKS